MKGFLITGTDTDVGKTWFMLKFGELLKEHKLKFHFLKPVESGCGEPNGDIIPKDAMQFSKLEGVSLSKICKFMFKAYASPPRAAKLESKNIDINDIIDFIEEKVNLPVILVVNNTLGCINHSLLSIQAIESLGLNIKFIILNDLNEIVPLDNFNELSSYTSIPVFRLKYNEKADSNLINFLV